MRVTVPEIRDYTDGVAETYGGPVVMAKKQTRKTPIRRSAKRKPAMSKAKLKPVKRSASPTDVFTDLSVPRIDLRLAHGNITEVDSRAVVLGFYEGVLDLSGAAQAIDQRMNLAITEILDRGMFLGRPGEIFILPAMRHDIRAELVILSGMGVFADFHPTVLEKVAENVARTLVRAKVDDFAMVLFGATRIMAGRKSNTAKNNALDRSLGHLIGGFFQGVRNSRALILATSGTHQRNPLRSITICDTSVDLCNRIAAVLPRVYEQWKEKVDVTLEEITLPAPRKEAKPGTAPIRLEVRQVSGDSKRSFKIRATLHPTGSQASGFFKDQVIGKNTFEELVNHVNEADDDEEKGFLYNTLRPKRGKFGRRGDDFEHALREYGDWMGKKLLHPHIRKALRKEAENRRIIVAHDQAMSRVAWETLYIAKWFPAADGGMSRHLLVNEMSLKNWLEERRLDDTLKVLLIVNPTKDLKAADKEGKMMEAMATKLGVELESLWWGNATKKRVQEELESGKYDVMHYAGHTNFDPDDASRSGIQCSRHVILSGTDLGKMKNLPALVFFNSCQSARVGGRAPKKPSETDRNIGLAEAFLRGGVANFVGTHWWVDDEPAEKFTKAFYGALRSGKSIGTAVSKGRQVVRRETENKDWADYIHYGNPDFVLKWGKIKV